MHRHVFVLRFVVDVDKIFRSVYKVILYHRRLGEILLLML